MTPCSCARARRTRAMRGTSPSIDVRAPTQSRPETTCRTSQRAVESRAPACVALSRVSRAGPCPRRPPANASARSPLVPLWLKGAVSVTYKSPPASPSCAPSPCHSPSPASGAIAAAEPSLPRRSLLVPPNLSITSPGPHRSSHRHALSSSAPTFTGFQAAAAAWSRRACLSVPSSPNF